MELWYLVMLLGLLVACGGAVAPEPITLPLQEYPPADHPYRIEAGNLWLVHTTRGELFVFSSVAPPYAPHVTIQECLFTWMEGVQRFTDLCSGDKWTLDGQLELRQSSEMWSNQDLTRYGFTVQGNTLSIHLDRTEPGRRYPRPEAN